MTGKIFVVAALALAVIKSGLVEWDVLRMTQQNK